MNKNPILKTGVDWYRTKLAERVSNLEIQNRRWKILERLVLKTQDGTIGQKDDDYPWTEGDMAVSVGDTYHQYPQPPDNSLGKLAVGAAMLMGGLGAGFGVSQIGNKPEAVSPPPPASQPFEDTDTSTRLELETSDGVLPPTVTH